MLLLKHYIKEDIEKLELVKIKWKEIKQRKKYFGENNINSIIRLRK